MPLKADDIFKVFQNEIEPKFKKILQSGKKSVIIVRVSQSKLNEIELRTREVSRNGKEFWSVEKINFTV